MHISNLLWPSDFVRVRILELCIHLKKKKKTTTPCRRVPNFSTLSSQANIANIVFLRSESPELWKWRISGPACLLRIQYSNADECCMLFCTASQHSWKQWHRHCGAPKIYCRQICGWLCIQYQLYCMYPYLVEIWNWLIYFQWVENVYMYNVHVELTRSTDIQICFTAFTTSIQCNYIIHM